MSAPNGAASTDAAPGAQDPWRVWNQTWVGWRIVVIVIIIVAIAALVIAIVALVIAESDRKKIALIGGSGGATTGCGCATTCDDTCTLTARMTALELRVTTLEAGAVADLAEDAPAFISSQLQLQEVIPQAATEIVWDTDSVVPTETLNWPARPDNRRFVGPKSGRYRLIYDVTFQPNNTTSGSVHGRREAWVSKNGVITVRQGLSKDFHEPADISAVNGSAEYFLNGTTDYLSVWVDQATGAPITISGSGAPSFLTNNIRVEFVGP